MLCRVILEFDDAAGTGRLNLNTGPLLFTKFRDLLDPTFCYEFD